MADATVVSLVPVEINEFKPGLIPEYTIIPAAKSGDFEILHVQDAAHILYLDSERGSRFIPEPVSEYARAICEDYIAGQVEVSREDNAFPGLFWVFGKLTKDQIKTNHKAEFAAALQSQIRWFERLIRRADDSWSEARKHDHIAKIMRIAARELKIEREWLFEDLQMGNVQCPACNSLLGTVMPIVCPNCRCILDKERHKTLSFAE